ncbi:MAG: hypothetical protein COB02_17070 [Candidatus Cloacimonadota bacterium]|nr:MAG: hypothetical protein COB02_17070 [Candidatus Cloacimonadota bacterium]
MLDWKSKYYKLEKTVELDSSFLCSVYLNENNIYYTSSINGSTSLYKNENPLGNENIAALCEEISIDDLSARKLNNGVFYIYEDAFFVRGQIVFICIQTINSKTLWPFKLINLSKNKIVFDFEKYINNLDYNFQDIDIPHIDFINNAIHWVVKAKIIPIPVKIWTDRIAQGPVDFHMIP